MSQITPFVKRMRTQGGTLYTFSSAVEDIGLNINERNNIVKMSNFALLDIPEITAPTNLQQNRFNPFAISGGLENFEDSASIKDGRVIVAESFQNYALNLETWLLSEDDYNPALLRTVSERVFWKWMKETGSVRWTKDVSNNGYFIEEIDTDSSVGYNSVVKYVGEISAGSVRTDTFGTYNETYVLVPTSHGQTRTYFKQTFDDNYFPKMKLGEGGINIKGRENYTKPHPDGLSMIADYDVLNSSTVAGTYDMFVDVHDGSSYQPGTWYTGQGQSFVDENWYATDSSAILDDPSTYNYNIKYDNGADEIEFQRSNVDAVGIEYNLNNLKNIFGDSTLTWDKMAIEDSVDDEFQFNAVLIYYTVYNKTLDKVLATNLLGVLFLDAAAGNTSGFPEMEIAIPQLTKLQSTATGFGSSYSFRVNIKSDNMIDDTQATIFDESTSSQTALYNWTSVFANLEKTLSILNQHTGTINYITEQYMDISGIQTQQGNTLTDVQNQINSIDSYIGDGTPGSLAMYAEGDDPLIDSSIYMNLDGPNDWIGVFTPDPSFPFHVDSSMKAMDITIENAIRDTSGNILLGYGSPLQIGSSTNYRQVNIYTGGITPGITVYDNNAVNIDGSVIINNGLDVSGNVSINESLIITGDLDVSGNVSMEGAGIQIDGYFKESSIGTGLIWNAGLLDVSTSGGGSGGITTISTLSPITGGIITSDGSIGIDQATTSSDGYLTSANWNTFNNKQTDVTGLSLGDPLLATDWLIASNGGTANRQVISGIGLSKFTNDEGWTSNAGTLTSIATGNGLTGGPITNTGTITMGTPGTLTGSTSNSVSASSHTHTINDFTSTVGGLAPASGGGTTNFLRADGTWQPAGGGGSGTVTSVGSGNGMNFTTINLSGLVSMATPSTVTSTSSNNAGTGTHSHALGLINTADITVGTLPVARGGTGVSSLSANHILRGGSSVTTSSGLQYNGSTLSVTGAATVTGEITGFYSDKRLKTDILPIESPLDKISQITGMTYTPNELAPKYNEDEEDIRRIGVFAQDVQSVLPEAIRFAPFDRDELGESISGEDYLTVNYENLVPLLLEGIKELTDRVKELEEVIKNKE